MNTENKLTEFALLAPYALIASVLFSLLSGVLLVAGLYDACRSEYELPERTLYTLVMYGAFSFSMGIAAFSSFHAFLKLRKLKTNTSENTISAAIHSLTAFLKAVYFWLLVVLLAAGISAFVPMN